MNPDTKEEKFSITIGDPPNSIEDIRTIPLSPVALAAKVQPLTATILANAVSATHAGASDSPTVVVAFTQPVVDIDKATQSVTVTGATVASVAPHIKAGIEANAYVFTLTPTGNSAITFNLVADQPCTSSSKGICTASGGQLTEAPSQAHTISYAGIPAVTLSLSSTSISENAGETTVMASLDQAATEATTIIVSVTPIAPAVAGDYTLSTNRTLTIAANARTSTDVVTITGVDNKADAANKTVTVSGVISSGSATAPSGVTLTITDDDTKGVTVDPTSLTLVEGGTDGTYAVNLNSQPLADVTVTPKSSDMSSVAVSGALTFTSSNWSEAQTVTVTAVSDTDMDNETVTITNAVAGDDTGYVGVTAASVSVSVRDDESANKAPIFTEGESTTRSVNENTAAGENVGAAVTAEGDDEDTLTYALNGADAGSFDFDTSTGQIAVKDALDHETKASYSLTVTVHDGKNSAGDADTGVDDYIAVTVSVVNVDEPGSVSFDSETPIVGTALEAIITDPDGNVRDVAYTWQSSADRNDWEHISGSLATYTPSAADMGKYLRVTASYADGPGGHEIRLARAETANPVRLPPDNNEP